MMSQVDLFVSICNYKRIWYATDGCVLVCLTFLVFSWVFPVGLLSTVGGEKTFPLAYENRRYH